MRSREYIARLLAPSGVILDGPNPWDPQIHDERLFGRFLSGGSLAVGESYMDGWWDVDDLSEFTARVLRSGVANQVFSMKTLKLLPHVLRHRFLNLQNKNRAFEVGEKHYDIGNDLYERMLDPTMTYTCAYWKDASTLEEAQGAKLDLVCRKIGLKKGDRILDIGCGWGSFLIHAALRYGASGVGVTVSSAQAELAPA